MTAAEAEPILSGMDTVDTLDAFSGIWRVKSSVMCGRYDQAYKHLAALHLQLFCAIRESEMCDFYGEDT